MAAATNNNSGDTNSDEINPELTHEEIWDDSVLVQAWDEALQEYKKYHSIAAKGEDAEALIKTAETETVMGDAPPAADPPAVKLEDNGRDDARRQAGTSDAAPAAAVPQPPELPELPREPPPPQVPAQPPEPPPFPFAQPHPAGPAAGYAVGGNNQELRNLMMAWYWAGYYVGLHEGQQKAQQQQ